MFAGRRMEQQYSVDFFAHFVSSVQDHCKSFLDFNQVVEVSGYVCVEIDNTKKERYVLSELVQSCGNVISESYCTKAFKVSARDLQGMKGNRNGQKSRATGTGRKQGQHERAENEGNRNGQKSRATGASQVPPPRITKTSKSMKEGDISDWGLKISSVTSLADIAAGSTSRREEGKHIKIEAENSEAAHHSSLYLEAPEQSPLDVASGLGEEAAERDGSDIALSKSFMSSHPEHYHLWNRSDDQGNLDLDQILNRGMDGFVQEQRDDDVAGVSTSKRKHVVCSSTTSSAGGDDDLTVLNNEYFTAQMLVHNRKALDPKEFKAASGTILPASTHQSRFQSTEPSTSQQLSTENPPPDFQLSKEQEDKSCFVVIDEESDEVIDVDMEDLDDESNGVLSESSQDVADCGSPAITTVLSRRSSASDEERQRKRYKSSLKYQRYAVKLFNDYQKNSGEGVRPIQTMHPEKLDEVLSDFYSSLRKANGEEFGSMSLRNVQSHLERYLKDANYPFSLTKDEKFKKSHETLRRKIAEARARSGHRALPVKLTPISELDVCTLFESCELGDMCPDSLLNTMWFMNSFHLRIKHNADHYNLRWGDICLARNNHGEEFLTHLVGGSQGREVYSDVRDPAQCFVRLYKLYRDRRPPITKTLDYPFYLAPDRNFPTDGAWFSSDRASIHRLTGIFKKITASAGLEGKKLL